MMTLKLVFLTLGLFLRTVLHGVTTQYHGGSTQQACERRGTLVPLNKRIRALLWKYRIVRMLSCVDVDPIRVLLDMSRSYKVNFDVEGGLGCFLYNFKNSFVSRVPAYDGINRGSAFTQTKECVSNWNEYAA